MSQDFFAVRPGEGQGMDGNEELAALTVPPPHFPCYPAGEALWAWDHDGPPIIPWLPVVQTGGDFLRVMATFSLSVGFCSCGLPRVHFELVNTPRGIAGRSFIILLQGRTLRLWNERGT